MKNNKDEIKAIIACCCAIFASMGLVDSQFPLYIKPIADELGLARNSVSLLASIRMIMTTLTALAIPTLYKRFGVKHVMISGIILVAIGLTGYATFSNLILLYLSAAIHGMGAISVMLGVPLILKSSVHPGRRGRVTGIVYSFTGIGGLVVTPLTIRMIQSIGWRNSFYVTVLMVLVISLVPFIRYIEKTYDVRGVEGRKDSNQQTSGNESAISMPIPLLFAVTVTLAYSLSVFNHAPAHFTEIGFEASVIMGIVSMYNIVMVGGNTLFGMIADRIGIKKIGIICAGIVSGMCALLAIMSHVWQAYLYGLMFGMGVPLMMVGIILLGASVIPSDRYHHIWSRLVMVQTLSFAAGTWLNGVLFDLSGSYRVGFSICAVTGLLTMIGMMTIRQREMAKNAGVVEREKAVI